MRCDGGPDETRHLTGLLISNSRYVGPFMGFPSSTLFDGVCHTLEMEAGRFGQVLHNLSSLTSLRFYEPGARQDVRAISLVFDQPALLKIDGELLDGIIAIDAVVQGGAITFRVPADSHA
jgi:diacylglycerol kinase family enzyme